ncbi:nucleotidyltransferase family protein [Picosynechococcus sp. PCC 8807]|uniref:nucleotidyltransferase family protein n=1 Tax=Picosynechococcus sp. PCC 8807 TaxID=195248 RepID=UPI000810E2D6|nr:nucleotidyltransferase family protein [Picosynechococcus sp. PCC 8807]ANV92070.1 DNA polymerase subunit beta [Picosynechococcus sp. PCC 8807]
MSLKSLVQEKRDQILALAVKHGAFNVRLFGSVARGEDTLDSDIDFLIDYDLERVSAWFPVGLIQDLEDLLGCRVDVVTEGGLKPRIRDDVLRDCVVL